MPKLSLIEFARLMRGMPEAAPEEVITAAKQREQNSQPVNDSRVDEGAFRRWYGEAVKNYNLNPNPDSPDQFYDYRAAFKAGAKPDTTGHWPSDYKKEGHPNMVVGGFNVKTGARVPGTAQANEAELIRLGWSPEDARRMSRIEDIGADEGGMTVGAARQAVDAGKRYVGRLGTSAGKALLGVGQLLTTPPQQTAVDIVSRLVRAHAMGQGGEELARVGIEGLTGLDTRQAQKDFAEGNYPELAADATVALGSAALGKKAFKRPQPTTPVAARPSPQTVPEVLPPPGLQPPRAQTPAAGPPQSGPLDAAPGAIGRNAASGVSENATVAPRQYTPKEAVDTIGQLHSANGGSTFNIQKGNLAGTDHYALSIFPERELKWQGKDLPPAVIAKYIQKNADLLADPNNSIGTWFNPEDGLTYLDVSTTVANLDDAIRLAQEKKQLAIFDLKNFKTIDTPPSGTTGAQPVTTPLAGNPGPEFHAVEPQTAAPSAGLKSPPSVEPNKLPVSSKSNKEFGQQKAKLDAARADAQAQREREAIELLKASGMSVDDINALRRNRKVQ